MDIYAECTQEKRDEVFANLNGKIMIKLILIRLYATNREQFLVCGIVILGQKVKTYINWVMNENKILKFMSGSKNK